jgi:hypothetical protein
VGRIVLAGLAFLALAIGLLAAIHLFEPVPEAVAADPAVEPLPEPLGYLTSGRPSLVYFYSGGCRHCVDKLPEAAALVRRMEARGATVVGVEYLGTRESVDRHRAEFSLPGTLLPDEQGMICHGMGAMELTLVVLDVRGETQYRGGGEDPAAVELALFP